MSTLGAMSKSRVSKLLFVSLGVDVDVGMCGCGYVVRSTSLLDIHTDI